MTMGWEFLVTLASAFGAGYFVGQAALARRVSKKLEEINVQIERLEQAAAR